MHPHKDWENDDYRAGGDWGRERHWPMHESQVVLLPLYFYSFNLIIHNISIYVKHISIDYLSLLQKGK